jgi:hypothetical protein
MEYLSDMRHTHQQFLVDLEKQFFDKKLSAAEFTALCLIPELVRNNTYFQKSPLIKEALSESPVMEFLRNYSWKGKSDRIRRSLFRWHQGHYPLVLWETIPTPFELLKLQAQGKRVITVFKNTSAWEKTHFGKSAWEFIVHDLIHADHFFENSDWRTGQIEFYQFVLTQWDHELISCIRTHCSEQFDYLISDMNSHPQHLYQTLSALSLMAWKKKAQVDVKCRLPSNEEEQLQKKMNHLLTTCLLK